MTNETGCVYRRDETSETTGDGLAVYECLANGKCTIEANRDGLAACGLCKQRLEHSGQRDFRRKYVDHLHVVDRAKQPTTALRDLLAGGAAFLVCGGPSANELPLEQLDRRGVFSMAVNNMAGHTRFRPSAFVCADPPSKFHEGIWRDPDIKKFVPSVKIHKRRGRIRRKVGDTFERIPEGKRDKSIETCPNVWGFGRRSWMRPDDSFFLEPDAAWGNHDSGVRETGEAKTVCTMLLAVRLLYYLGARRIFLVGVDFTMSPTSGYAFAQARDADASAKNNSQFSVVNDWLCRMEQGGVFARFGLSLYNANPHSGLRAFGHVPFDAALRIALEDFPAEPFDLKSWYDK